MGINQKAGLMVGVPRAQPQHTIKFGPAVSQKELEKVLNDEPRNPGTLINLHKLKVRVEFVGDFEDVRKVKELLKQRQGK